MRIGSPFLPLEKLLSRKIAAGSKLGNKAFLQLISQFLSKNYHWLIPLLGSLVILLETIEHFTHIENRIGIYYAEVAIIATLLIATGFLTRILLISLRERSQAIDLLGIKHNFRKLLSSGEDMDQIVRQLGRQAALLIPGAEIELYLFDKHKSRFVFFTDPQTKTSTLEDQDSQASISSIPCEHCIQKALPTLCSLDLCNQKGCLLMHRERNGYCLPLVHGSQPIGLLQIFLLEHQELSAQTVEIIENIADEISGSLAIAIEKMAREDIVLAQKVRTIQLDIARDLHDTIGQNIGFLRMKLDQLSETEPQEKPAQSSEILRMRDVANESYDLIRGTLAVLQSENSNDLLHLFSRYAGQVAERSRFIVDIATHGEAVPLKPSQMRQLFYVFREAISNVEKHAKASRVCVELNWLQNHLELSVSDNGIGFNPSHAKQNGHYGLQFMQERIKNISGSFSINSTINSGTSVAVRIPYE